MSCEMFFLACPLATPLQVGCLRPASSSPYSRSSVFQTSSSLSGGHPECRRLSAGEKYSSGDLLNLLDTVASGEVSPEDAELVIRALSTSEPGRLDSAAEMIIDDFAVLDLQRSRLTSFPEVIWGPGKTPEQITTIMASLVEKQGKAMATRIKPHVAEQVKQLAPWLHYSERACIIFGLQSPCNSADTYQERPEMAIEGDQDCCLFGTPVFRGSLCILSAGTADIPVAEEALLTARFMGCRASLIADVGVAGLHRLLRRLPTIRKADVVVVVAGMDGALPSVVAGLIEAPVISVPTSIGYGAAFGGVAPLLSSLNSCAPGVLVVNIDNGFGAAMAAARILNTIHNRSGKDP